MGSVADVKPDYKSFILWALKEGPWSGCDLDGVSVQEKALSLGIIKRVPYDPDIHGDNSLDVQPGDDWYVLAES